MYGGNDLEQTFSACEASIADISQYFSKRIKEYKISGKLCREYELLMEEVITKVVLAADPDSELTFEIKKHLGKITAKIKCPGKPVLLDSEESFDFSGQIIKEYSEYLRQSYSFGVNEIVFTTSFSSDEILIKNLISIGLAVAVGIILHLVYGADRLLWIKTNITLPVVSVFINCMQTVAIPVAFFSLAAFIVNVRRAFDRNNKTIKLSIHYVISSMIAIALGVLVWLIFSNFAPSYDLSAFKGTEDNFIGNSLKAFLTNAVSTNIIEPFRIPNPIPFLVNAILTGLAASSLFGKSGETLQNGLISINDLFARMMNIIYGTIPFFIFFAVVDLILKINRNMLKMVGLELLSVAVAMIFLVVYYMIRLLVGRVSIKGFFKNYSKLIADNLKIASNIDSLPYNKRILSRKMKLSRDYLDEGLKLGILLNMDGNCLTVTVVLMNMVTAAGVNISPMKYLGVAIIMLLFSVGAPNLPGSFLLGMIILMSFVGISSELVAVVLIFEALISKFYSFLNAAGDIITLVVEDEQYRRKLAKEKA